MPSEISHRAFATWRKQLVVRDDILGGEPVFPRSRLAVRQIGEMARRGAPVKDILEDLPVPRAAGRRLREAVRDRVSSRRASACP